MAVETTALTFVLASVRRAGRAPTARCLIVQMTVVTRAAVSLGHANASKASPVRTAVWWSVLLTVERRVSASTELVFVMRASLVPTARRQPATTTAWAVAAVWMETVCVMSPGLARTVQSSSA